MAHPHGFGAAGSGFVPRPLVSVGIPTYNRSHYLGIALDSVLAQTHRDLEVVVVDDGSTDDTSRVVAARAASDPRVTYLRNDVNLGMGETWTRAFAHARGTYYALLTDDDVWDPSFLEVCVGALDRHPECVLAFTNLWVIDGAGRRGPDPTAEDDRWWRRTELRPGPMSEDEHRVCAFDRQCIPLNGAVYRAEALRAAGAYDPRAGMSLDYHVTCRVALRGGGAYWVGDRLLGYRVHGGSATATKRRETAVQLQETVSLLLPDVDDAMLRSALAERWHRAAASEGYAALEAGDVATARRSLRRAMAHRSTRSYAVRGYCATFLPVRLQSLVRTAVRRARAASAAP